MSKTIKRTQQLRCKVYNMSYHSFQITYGLFSLNIHVARENTEGGAMNQLLFAPTLKDQLEG